MTPPFAFVEVIIADAIAPALPAPTGTAAVVLTLHELVVLSGKNYPAAPAAGGSADTARSGCARRASRAARAAEPFSGGRSRRPLEAAAPAERDGRDRHQRKCRRSTHGSLQQANSPNKRALVRQLGAPSI